MNEPSGISPDALRRFTHDVVSPLMSVVALTEVLLLEARKDDRLNEDLRRIHAAADEALGMIRALSAELKSKELDAGH